MNSTDIEDVYELTPLQQGLLFHCLNAPSAGFYIEQMHFTLRGELRADVIGEAWTRIIARHPGLRTSFSWEDINRPVQVVHTAAQLPLDEVDLSNLPEDERERAFTEYLLAERHRGFDLESAPLLRLTVFRFGGDTFRLAWRFSHLVMDGWSFGLIMSDFVTLYKAIYHGRTAELPPASSPGGYVAWWRRQDPAASRDYWEDTLRDYLPPPPLDLGDRGEPVSDTVQHGYVELELGELAERLRGFSRERRLTLNTLVQGAWALVLSRCYGSPDVVVGATMSHRPPDVPGCDSIVGPLIVTLPVRTLVGPETEVEKWLHQLQADVLGARDHAGAPLPVIRGWSKAARSADLFESIVSYENVPIPDISFAEENMEMLGFDVDGRPQYPMSLIVLPGDDIPLRLIYDSRRFGAASARRMLARVHTALSAFVDEPERTLGTLDVVPQAERDEILAQARGTETLPVGRSLLHVVREHADRTPDKIAVVGEGGSLTFAELMAAADRVARELRTHGVRRGDRVAICAGRNPRLIVGMLGILACGAAYVPLDPANPAERHAFVLRDCTATAIVTEQGLAGLLDDAMGDGIPPVVLLDADVAEADARPGAPVDDEGESDDVAYAMYTSGSTGEPKGVLVTHRNVLRLIEGGRRQLALDDDDVWSMFFSPAFDGSTWEIWGALTQGARLIVVPREVSRSPENLLALLAAERVTVCTQTPSAFRQLMAADAWGAYELALRLVVLGGEKVDPATLRDWFDRRGDTPWIVNAYGPTEATVWVCHHRLLGEESNDPAARSLIGRPLPDTGIYLLDRGGMLAPMGAPGEMYLAGPGVAAGYLNRPELDAECFVDDAFSAAPQRMYASGDLARLTADGELEYVGRADSQVKVRGYRVELGEIESRLQAHTGVRAAVVIVRGEQLLAFVVPADDAGRPSTDELKRFAVAALPEYMVPKTITLLAEIPLTANGKVDHQALPDADRPSDAVYVAPRNPTEQRLTEILSELLGAERIGVDDDLQDLGLHSLVATRVINVLRATWQVSIPLRRLFESPTVASLASIVHSGGAPRIGPDRPGHVELEGEAVLGDDIVAAIATTQHRDWAEEPQHVFITGATGFPGAFLAAEVLRTTGATAHCLVRATDAAVARERLRDHLLSLGLWDEEFADRVDAVPGDLSQPFLGLSRDEFGRYADLADEIFHFGAYVNFLYPYRRLRSVNVQGTKEVLRLAATGRNSVLHHVSSVGIFAARPSADGEFRGAEVELDPKAPALPNGYTETKWVAERLVTVAGEHGLRVVTHRLGRVSGHSRTGMWKATNDALAELLKASAGLGSLPRFEGMVDMVPVDYVAEAMVAIARRRDAIGGIFHLVNARPLTFDDLRRGFELAGYPSGSAEMTRWYAELVGRSTTTSEDWSVAIALLGEWTQHASYRMQDPRFDSTQTREFLDDTVSCPAVDGPVLVRYLRHLADTGFLRSPADSSEGAATWQAVPVSAS